MGSLGDIRVLLIANRGEIACRVARTARALGIRTVAVYSDADAGALHVRSCDLALRIGPAPAAESYLNIDAILRAAGECGADAIHPGYGFLSENPEFATRCAQAGIRFVGPPAAAIAAMGLKSAAKALMQKAGVPLMPGYHGADQNPVHLKQEAQRIGLPMLIKASAGGGGRGMRRVDRLADFDAALSACKREAAASFGNDDVILERYVLQPRHIEVQVFADVHGGCVALFERDCSVQRRHQKVLEEAPAPGLAAPQRLSMYAAAVAAAQAVGYVGAGTVEFIRAPSGEFYFMEMNTRLQVEHPVTEMITGLDLVEWQLRIAAGEALPRAQKELVQRGHAIEARIYAEDPDRGFLPAAGRLSWFKQPAPSQHVRMDAGVAQGDVITPYYDPMIAKLIVWDHDRAAAVARLQGALAGIEIAGLASNVEFLQRLVGSDSFTAGKLDTELIEREETALFPERSAVPDMARIAVVARLLQEERESENDSPWSSRRGWRLLGAPATRVLHIGRVGDAASAAVQVQIEYQHRGLVICWADRRAQLEFEARGHATMHLSIDGCQTDVTVVHDGERFEVFGRGMHEALRIIDPRAPRAEAAAEASLRAPMPGRIIAILQTPGTQVEKGAPLLVMEAMKMEHAIAAPARGRVAGFRYAIGDQVSEGADLVQFEIEASAT